MAINPDFRDLFVALNAASCRYLLVGGYALALYAVPRFTKDLDVWVEASPENAPRILAALEQFGAPVASLSEADFRYAGTVFQIGLPPNRIDIVTSIDGFLLTPLLTGRFSKMNNLAVFTSLLFWGWLWGAPGILLAVPIMMVIKSVCDHIEELQPIGHFLGEGK